MVARAKFRGANKRAMYTLKGTGTTIPVVGEGVEWQLGDKWRNCLAAIRLGSGEIYVQVIMNNDMEADSVFRVMGMSKSSSYRTITLFIRRELIEFLCHLH